MSGEDSLEVIPLPGIPIVEESGEPVALKKPLKNRLTVVSRIYHQRVGKDPKSIEPKFTRDLESRGQLYEREMEATEEWQPLECGWVEDAGFLVIVNQEGQNLQVHPTDEEREALAKNVLCLCYNGQAVEDCLMGSWLIPPGESFQGFPSRLDELYIRSQVGVVEYTIYLIPR